MKNILRAKALVDDSAKHPERWTTNLAEAEQILRAELHAEPTNVAALTCLGAVLCDAGKHAEAALPLREAARLGSDDRHTYFNLGVATLNVATQAAAMAYFKQAQQLQAGEHSWAAYFDPQAQ